MNTKRRVQRREDKQISFYTTYDMHNSIKNAAKSRKTTIKEYLIGLHMQNLDVPTADQRIEEIHKLVKQLVDNQTFLLIPGKDMLTKSD